MKSAAAVLIAASVIVALSHLLQQRSTDPPPTRPATGNVRVLGAPPPTSHEAAPWPVEDERAPRVRPAPAAATQTARRFLAAYLSWESGGARHVAEPTMRHLATSNLWHVLSSSRGQPEPGTGVTRAQLRSLIAGVTGNREAATVSAVLHRGDTPTQLAVVVRKVDGQWRVSSLGR